MMLLIQHEFYMHHLTHQCKFPAFSCTTMHIDHLGFAFEGGLYYDNEIFHFRFHFDHLNVFGWLRGGADN